MMDRTVYAADAVPLRQILGRQIRSQRTSACKLVADSGPRRAETFAMLGDTMVGAQDPLIPDHAKLGDDQPTQELALTSLAAVWKTCSTIISPLAEPRRKKAHRRCRRSLTPKMAPNSVRPSSLDTFNIALMWSLPIHREPHRTFACDHLLIVHVFSHFYEVCEIRTRNEQIAQKSGLARTGS